MTDDKPCALQVTMVSTTEVPSKETIDEVILTGQISRALKSVNSENKPENYYQGKIQYKPNPGKDFCYY